MSSFKELFIVRHAKSSWDYENISDIDRPLKLKGIRDAYEMARRIKIERKIPDLMISSPAIRALHTADIFMRVLEDKYSKLKIDERLYGSGVGVIKKLLAEQTNSIKVLMIFGHNPDFSELATVLSGSSYLELISCGVAYLKFETSDWSSVSHENIKEFKIDSPKNENLV
ncbi:MAG: histidine phosphatase family protein [Bacteroidales bacterium]|nr:histidine phosphatase family protein [Bacteroidales bacterium]MBN2819025.1 histidine phosphatase family protein [Bacteroidales bacterium]